MLQEDKKVDYDKENECSLCYCSLFDGLQEMPMADAIKLQQGIYSKKMNGKANEDDLPVVRLGNCQGMHFFHKECIENQLKSGESNQFLKCAICNTLYGKQTGEMPPGTMAWSSHPFSKLPLEGYTPSNCPSVIVIDYALPSGRLSNGA